MTSLGSIGECEEDCDGRNDYSDGIFSMCKCRARIMNTVVGANYVNARNERPVKVVAVVINRD